MEIVRVTSRADLRAFCEFPVRLHPRDLYVPSTSATIAQHARTAELYLAVDHGQVVGRTSVHRDAAFDARVGPRQLFGHTEFTDAHALGALMGLVATRAEGRPLFGPVSLLPNQTGGVITSGFGSRGFVDSAWNPAYYPVAYRQHGFVPRFEGDTWIVPVTGSEAGYAFDDARMATERLVIRHGSRRRLAQHLPILREMLNASFAQLDYFTEVTAELLAEQTDGLVWVLDERLLLWLEKDGRPVAFIVTVPDISDFLLKVGGRLGVGNQLRLLATRRRYRRDAVLLIKGTVPDQQGRGYLTLLARELHRNLAAGGYATLRSTFVERDNPASAAQYRRAGGRELHGYTFYERMA